MIASLLDGLSAVRDVITDPAVMEGYRTDQAAPGLLRAGTPAAVVRPTSTAEVQAAVRAAAEAGVPLVPRGAGSGLSGGANAIDGGVVLCLERMTSVLDIDTASLTATVQAGLVNEMLVDAAAEHALWYAPDPASRAFCTIGGNVATNAGGLCCVKYGVTRDALLGVEAVLADGRAVRLGRRARKGVAGYDLVSLLCGSEGTLAVITEATVRLQPPPGPASTLAATFPTLASAGEAIARIAQRHRPSLLEVMDRRTIAAVEAFQPMDLDLDVAALVFAQSDELGGTEHVAAMARVCEQAGAELVVTSDDPAEGRMLMAARRLAYPALERAGATLLDDVAVPLGAIPRLIGGIEAIADRHQVDVATFGHAGDGNMHPTIVYDPSDPAEVERAQAAFAAIVTLAVELGGTSTGEHGVGALKRAFLADEVGPDVLDLHQTIKQALDPDGVLNPGKAL